MTLCPLSGHFWRGQSDTQNSEGPAARRIDHNFVLCCSFLRGRKFPGTVRLTRTGDDSQARDVAGAGSRSAVQSPQKEAPKAEADDRQTRSLHGEPSTSHQVQTFSSIIPHATALPFGSLGHWPYHVCGLEVISSGWAGCKHRHQRAPECASGAAGPGEYCSRVSAAFTPRQKCEGHEWGVPWA